MALVLHTGGCHCRAVRFEVKAPAELQVQLCNCSICTTTAYLHLIVPTSRFNLERGREQLTEYTFNTEIARHFFCRICGVKSFYVPRSNPDGISVNARCLDPQTIKNIVIENFNGQQWESSAQQLAHLSISS